MTTIQALVDRFLGWKLPATFNPDAGISFKVPTYGPLAGITRDSPFWPIGTNLFTADQAREMLEYLLGTPAPMWVIGKQHPEYAEVSMFTTSSEHTAKEYERLGWTVRMVHVLPDLDALPTTTRPDGDGVKEPNTDSAGRAYWVAKPGESLPHDAPSGGKGDAAGATRQAGETPATVGVNTPDEWAEVERVRDLPEVDEALLNLRDDWTGDNAAMVVRAVMRAARGVEGKKNG